VKKIVTDNLNNYLISIRKRRKEFAADKEYVRSILRDGIDSARNVAESTLSEVRSAMNMAF